jgi:hypothetical protein
MSKKSEWMNHILKIIAKFADLNWQHKERVLKPHNPYASFQESMCQLNDDAYFEDIVERYVDQFNLNSIQIQKLREFHKILSDYCDEHSTFGDDAEMLNDPNWHKVVRKAQEVLEVFKNYKILEDTELNFNLL